MRCRTRTDDFVETEVEIIVIVQPIAHVAADRPGHVVWSPDFFDSVIGKWQGERLTRQWEGRYTTRERCELLILERSLVCRSARHGVEARRATDRLRHEMEKWSRKSFEGLRRELDERPKHYLSGEGATVPCSGEHFGSDLRLSGHRDVG